MERSSACGLSRCYRWRNCRRLAAADPVRTTIREVPLNVGLLGGIIGGAIGLAGGAIGTYFSIKNTDGPSERSFMVRVAVIAWVVIVAFLAGLLLLPKPYNWLLWLPYAIALPLSIRWCNRRQLQIRDKEAASRAPRSSDS